MYEVDLALDARALVGECPVWDTHRECLWWVDVRRGEVHRYDGVVDDVVVRAPGETLSAVVPRTDGGLLIARGSHLDARSTDGVVDWSIECPDGDRLNDGKCDPVGRFLVGSLTYDPSRGVSALYAVTARPSPDVRRLLGGLGLSNGLGWSPDAMLLYFVDTATRRVDVFDYDAETGCIAGRRCLADLADHPGNPDGLAVDAQGCVWVAMSGAGRILRVSPRGDLVGTVELPVSRVTSCTFGGSRLTELYVTTASYGLDDQQRRLQIYAGGLFVIDVGIAGLPAIAFPN